MKAPPRSPGKWKLTGNQEIDAVLKTGYEEEWNRYLKEVHDFWMEQNGNRELADTQVEYLKTFGTEMRFFIANDVEYTIKLAKERIRRKDQKYVLEKYDPDCDY